MRLWFFMQDKSFPFSHARWDFSVFSCKMRHFGSSCGMRLRFSHAECDFPVFLCRMRLLGFLILHETFRFSYPTWDFSVFLSMEVLILHDFLVFSCKMRHFGSSCKMRFSSFLMQNETFRFSHPEWDFPVFLCRMRLLGFLILHETFGFSYPTWDFSVILSYMRLFVRSMKKTKQKLY